MQLLPAPYASLLKTLFGIINFALFIALSILAYKKAKHLYNDTAAASGSLASQYAEEFSESHLTPPSSLVRKRINYAATCVLIGAAVIWMVYTTTTSAIVAVLVCICLLAAVALAVNTLDEGIETVADWVFCRRHVTKSPDGQCLVVQQLFFPGEWKAVARGNLETGEETVHHDAA